VIRRDFLGALAFLGLCAPWAARAVGKVPRIGYLVHSPLVDPPSPERAAFLDGLRALGYEDGRNVVIEYRSARSDAEMLPFLADELVASKVDVIVAVGTPPAVAARKATATIPIVFLFLADPVGTLLVESLVRPGGNATGMSSLAAELGAKRLDLLKETLPRLSRVAVLWDSGFLIDSELNSIQATARSFGIAVQSVDIGGHPDLTAAFATLVQTRPDALLVTTNLRTHQYRNIIADFAIRQRLPTMFGRRDFVVSGGLMSYATDFSALSRRAASYVDRILRGVKPADLPVEQPTQFEMVVNLKTAKMLGITIPQSILIRADEVIR
jgi:putative ABC transport system substrate-binding protein